MFFQLDILLNELGLKYQSIFIFVLLSIFVLLTKLLNFCITGIVTKLRSINFITLLFFLFNFKNKFNFLALLVIGFSQIKFIFFFNKNKSTFSCSIGGTPIATMSGLSCKIIFFHEVKYLNGKLLLISLLDFPDIPTILNLSDI